MNDDNKTTDMDDLEAQLSSLGIYGGDDGEDPFASFNFDEDDPFASLEALSKPAPPKAAPKPMVTLEDLDSLDELNTPDFDSAESSPEVSLADLGLDLGDDEDDSAPAPKPATLNFDDDDMDLDKQLEMLLMADQAADENFEIKDVSASMPKQTVYDPEADGMVSVQYVKGVFAKDEAKEKLFANISFGKMIATFVIGVIIIVTGLTTAIMAISAVQAQQNLVSAVEHFTPVEIPTGVANNANIIFVNERVFVNEQPFTLTRFSAAFSGTFFYFEENFNPDDYKFLLFNQARNLYSRTSFNIISEPESDGTVLQFGALSPNTLFLTLHIQCKKTDETARFYYRFLTPPSHETPVFFTQPMPVMGDSPLIISHATFDNASSTIHFNYRPTAQSEGFRLSNLVDVPKVAIYELHTAVTPFTNGDSYVRFDDLNMLAGVATFGPVLSLESHINVAFYGLTYFKANPVAEVTPEQLFGNYNYQLQASNAFPVQTGAFTLMLEGMAQRESLITLTLHGLDENRRRRATNIGATLRVEINDDEFVDMPGIVSIHPEGRGTDVKFEMFPHGHLLGNAHISQYSLLIDWVEYDVPSANVELNVRKFFNQPSFRRYAAETAVTEAFLSLLALKSGEITSDGLIGISRELNNSLDLFAPTEFEGRAMYAASVTTGELVSNYDYAAIVEVVWAAEENTSLKHFRETFRVTARSSDNIWTITEIKPLA
jgi:hypothetical protein